MILCTYTYLTILARRQSILYIYICVAPKACIWMFVCACTMLVYLYNIILYTIYMATVLSLGYWTKECYLQLSFIRRRVVEFPFWWSYNNKNNNKETIFSSSFLSSRSRDLQLGRGCSPDQPF